MSSPGKIVSSGSKGLTSTYEDPLKSLTGVVGGWSDVGGAGSSEPKGNPISINDPSVAHIKAHVMDLINAGKFEVS